MKEIEIYLPDLLSNKKYLCDTSDKHDLLGQILYSLGYTVEPKQKLPSDLLKSIPPFTYSCRGKIVDTGLSLQIIGNSGLSPREQINRANALLKTSKIVLIPITDKQLTQECAACTEAEKSLEQQYKEIQESPIHLTNVARTSVYTCPYCSNSQSIVELEQSINKDSILLSCAYCDEPISKEIQDTLLSRFGEDDLYNKFN